MTVYRNLWETYQAIKWIGCNNSETRLSITDVARICEINWVTARNCLECLKKLGLAEEKQEIINGKYKRTFKGIIIKKREE